MATGDEVGRGRDGGHEEMRRRARRPLADRTGRRTRPRRPRGRGRKKERNRSGAEGGKEGWEVNGRERGEGKEGCSVAIKEFYIRCVRRLGEDSDERYRANSSEHPPHP